jgi:hypothetical protein
MRKYLPLVVVVVLLLGFGRDAGATLNVAIDTSAAYTRFVQNLSAPQTGSLDVFLTKDAGTYGVASYNARIDASSVGIVLTGAGTPSAAHPALFPTTPLVSGTSTDSLLRVSDLLASGEAGVTDGAGLFSIKFTIPAGAVGDFPLTINPNETLLFDGAAMPVALGGPPGTVTIHVSPVPEPGGLLVMGGLVMLRGRGARSRKRRVRIGWSRPARDSETCGHRRGCEG